MSKIKFQIWTFKFTFLGFFLCSCGGYYIAGHGNYFVNYGVHSICVPTFINDSLLPGVSGIFTQNFFNVLTDINNLKVYSGLNQTCDAVLVGIIHSEDRKKSVFSVQNRVLIENGNNSSIGDRNSFFVPSTVLYKFNLRILVIRNLHNKGIEEFLNYPTDVAKAHPALILDQEFVIEKSMSVRNDSPIKGSKRGLSNFTQNHYELDQGLRAIATEKANEFKQVVLNAF